VLAATEKLNDVRIGHGSLAQTSECRLARRQNQRWAADSTIRQSRMHHVQDIDDIGRQEIFAFSGLRLQLQLQLR
jgi:hypothetical protein